MNEIKTKSELMEYQNKQRKLNEMETKLHF